MHDTKQTAPEVVILKAPYEHCCFTVKIEHEAGSADFVLDDDSLDGFAYAGTFMAVLNEEGSIDIVAPAGEEERLELTFEEAAGQIVDMTTRLLDCPEDAFPELKDLLLQMFKEWGN